METAERLALHAPARRCASCGDEVAVRVGWLDDLEMRYRPRRPAAVYACPRERCGWARYEELLGS